MFSEVNGLRTDCHPAQEQPALPIFRGRSPRSGEGRAVPPELLMAQPPGAHGPHRIRTTPRQTPSRLFSPQHKRRERLTAARAPQGSQFASLGEAPVSQ